MASHWRAWAITGAVCLVAVVAWVAVVVQAPSRIVTVESYGLIDTPEAAAEFSGNDLVFEAVVVGHRPTRLTQATDVASAAVVEYTYTPVDVVVTAVAVGDLVVGDRVVVRALGGRVGDVEYVFEDTATVEAFAPGTALMLFTEAKVDVDGIAAVTPNFVYIVENGVARSAVHPTAAMEVEGLRGLVNTRRP